MSSVPTTTLLPCRFCTMRSRCACARGHQHVQSLNDARRRPREGNVIALKDPRIPMFVLGTETNHIAPWHSVYEVHLFTDTELTFVLTNGGHNTGIVSEPGHAGGHHDIATWQAGDRYVDAATWRSRATRIDGSWWPEWVSWLVAHSDPERHVAIWHDKLLQRAGGTCARAFRSRWIFFRGFCAGRISARALWTGRTRRCFCMGRRGAGRFSATCAWAFSAPCAGAVFCTTCAGAPTCACASFSAAQAWNGLNRASDDGSLFSV